MTSQQLFDHIKEQLAPGWDCLLASFGDGGEVRLQLGADVPPDADVIARKCIEAETLEKAIEAAVEFTRSMTPTEYEIISLFGEPEPVEDSVMAAPEDYYRCSDVPQNIPEPKPNSPYTPVELTEREAFIIRCTCSSGDLQALYSVEEIAMMIRDVPAGSTLVDIQADTSLLDKLCSELNAMVAQGLLWHESGKYRAHVIGFMSEMVHHYKAKYPQKFESKD